MRILHFGAVLTMLLAACGGGGGDGDTPVDAAEADMVETADDLAAKDGTSPDDAATETAADQLVQLPPIDYLVITASGLMATAEAFAEYRASTGHVTFVATVQSAIGGLAAPTDSIIVDEITGFVRGHYYKRDPDKPFFLLIVGDADASDNDPNETVPAGTWVGGWEGCRSDNFYADVDGDHVPDLAVGRIPVRSNADGQLILDKIMKHESEYEVGPWNHRLHVYAGEGGFGDDIDMFIEKIAEEGLVSVPYEYDLYFAYDSPTSTYYYTPFEEKVFGLVTDGALLVTYMGHGGGELDVPDLSQVVVKHRQPSAARCFVVPHKGALDVVATEMATHGLRDFGIQGAVILKSDNAEAIDALRHRVQAMHPGSALGHMPAAHEHESNGVVENGNKLGKGLQRVLLLALEARIGGGCRARARSSRGW